MPSAAPASRKRLLVLAALLLAALGALALRLRDFVEPEPQPGPDAVETWRRDDARLTRLQTASIPAPTEPGNGDWPQWRGPGRDGVSREASPPQPWPKAGPRVIWKARGGPGHSSISIAGDRAYTLVQDGDREAVICLSAATGQEFWRYGYPAQFDASYAGAGPHATPTVADGRVYTVGSTGQFHCLDAATGKALWHHDLLAEFETPNLEYGLSCSPLVEGELVIVLPGSAKGGSVAAFDRKTGALVWKALDDRAGYSSPLAATIAGQRQIVVVTGATVAGLRPAEGSVLWSFAWASQQNCNIATPIVAGDYVFVSASYTKGCALIEISAGPEGALMARSVYEHNRMRNQFATSVLDREHLYGFDEDFLVCMELRSGKVRWKTRGFDRGSLILAGGRLVILGANGRLALVQPDPARYDELAVSDFTQSRTWAPPSVSRQRLFLRDQEWIYGLDVGPEK